MLSSCCSGTFDMRECEFRHTCATNTFRFFLNPTEYIDIIALHDRRIIAVVGCRQVIAPPLDSVGNERAIDDNARSVLLARWRDGHSAMTTWSSNFVSLSSAVSLLYAISSFHKTCLKLCNQPQIYFTHCCLNVRYSWPMAVTKWWLGSRVVSIYSTRAQKGLDSNCSRDAIG